MKILIIQPGYLGDTVFLGPLIRVLKSQLHESVIGVCVSPRGEAVARLLPGCDSVFVFDKRSADRGLRGIFRIGKVLRHFDPEIALTVNYSWRSGLLACLSGATRRIGYPPERVCLRFDLRSDQLARKFEPDA